MNYARIVQTVFNSPWAIDRAWFGSIFSLLQSRVFAGEHIAVETPPYALHGRLQSAGMGGGSGRFTLDRYGLAAGAVVNFSAQIRAEALRKCGGDPGTYYDIVESKEAALPVGQILHIFGSGILGKHLSSMDETCAGGLSVDRIQEALRTARDDDRVQAIMLHLDTPGGISCGMQETAALVRQVTETKTVASFCDSLTASAGVWCTCAADYAYVTPSADVGSVGVYSAFVDYTEWCKKQGVSVDLITDGSKYKGAGYPGTALTEEQRAKIQADVMQCAEQFRADVRQGRAGIGDDAMQGQTFTGAAAVKARFADAVVMDLETALADLAQTL
jgi:ClpP class serine protease